MSKIGDVIEDTIGLVEDVWDNTVGALWDSLSPDIPEPETQSMSKGLQKGIDQPRRITLGRDRVGGVIAHQDTVTRDDKEFIQLIVLISGAPIDALEQVYIADKPITTYASDSWSYLVSDGYHTTANTMAVSKMKGWTSAHIGFNQAHIFIELENNREVFTDGISDCEFLIRGVRVFDPRDIEQSADDKTTWKWSDNAVLNTLHYMRFFGAHPVPIERLPMPWWIAAINVCDELVSYKDAKGLSKSEKRYCVNGTFLFTSNPLDVLSRLESAFAGKVFRQMGAWYVRVGAWYGAPTHTIEQSDVNGNIKIKWHPDLRSRANIVRATFTDPNQNYERTDATPIVSQLYKIKDGQPLEKTISLPFVRSETHAQRIAVIALEQSRLGSIEIPLKRAGLKAAVGKTIFVNLPKESIINKIYRVTERRFRIDGGVTLIAVEDSFELWSDSLEPSERDLTPNSSYVVGELLAPTAVSVDVADSRITVNWVHPTPKSVSSYDVTVFNGPSAVYRISSEHESIMLPIFDAGTYVISVLAKNILGKQSRAAASQFSIVNPVTPTINIIDISDVRVSLSAFSQAIGLGTAYLWEFLGEDDAPIQAANITSVRADAFTYTGLKPETNYSVRCKSVNISGESDWALISLKTLSYQDVFESKNLVVSTQQLSQETQQILADIPNVQSKLDDTLKAFNVTNSAVFQLKTSFNKMGLDVTQSQADLSTEFAHVIESFADTNQFVFEINEALGTLLVEGGKVSFDEFTAYQLKVDTFEGTLNSVSTSVVKAEESLLEAHSLINQNTESLKLLVGDSTLSDTLAIVRESSIRLTNVENDITVQTMAAKAKDFATLNAFLSNEISVMQLIESEVDAAVSNETRASEIDGLRAKANVLETVIASFKESLGLYTKSVDITASINRASAIFKEQLNARINALSSGYSKEIKVISDENTAVAQRTESLESKVNLETGETVKSIAQSAANARVSYCSIGRDTDGNIISNSEQCEIAGGTWIDNAPISELLYAVKVTNNEGKSVSALSYLTALETENGELKARAFFGIDAKGKSGILVYNSKTGEYEHTVLDLTADNILFRSPNGDVVMRLNTDTKNLIIDAEIHAKKLVLSDGEVYKKADLKGEKGDIPAVTSNGDGSYTITGNNGEIIIRNGNNAPIPTVKDNGNGTHTVTDGTGNSVIINDGEKGDKPLEGVDYIVQNGVNGNHGAYLSSIYKVGSGTPSGGSFDGTNETIPAGWSDNPVFTDGQITYISTVKYTHNGTNWVRGSWSSGTTFIKQGAKGDSVKGGDGERGSKMFTVGTSNGSWSNSIANSATVKGLPVVGDIVTIYKNNDISVATTKKYTGSSWVGGALIVHGNAIFPGSVDANVLKANSKISSPVIESIGVNHMTVTAANGFGANNEFVEWRGPKKLINGQIDFGFITRSNAYSYLTVNGDGYLGGTFATSESFKNSGNSSETSDSANVTLLGIETRGANITITANYSLSGSKRSNYLLQLVTPKVTLLIQLLVNGSWITKTSKLLIGTSYDESAELGGTGSDIHETMSGQLMFSHKASSAGLINWRVIIQSRDINGGNTYQNITLKTEE